MKSNGFFIFITAMIMGGSVWSQGKTEAGLSLLEAPHSRAAAMGEAFSAATDDIASVHYNPANLTSIFQGDATFMYQEGAFDDTFGQVLVGYPRFKDAWGISIGYYNSGKTSVFDGVSRREVTAQSDITVGFAWAYKRRDFSFGLGAKYLSSELAETARASAVAADIGVSYPILKKVNLAGSLQNFGTKMKYVSAEDELPRLARGGIQWRVKDGFGATLFLLDGQYFFNRNLIKPAAGIETLLGPVAVRAGYKGGADLEEFTVGTGFIFGSSSLDYSFGLMDEFDSRHRISFMTRFGQVNYWKEWSRLPRPEPLQVTVKAEEPAPAPRKVEPLTDPERYNKRFFGGYPKSEVYVVKSGDSLKTLAEKFYGTSDFSDDIYRANKHLLPDPQNLVPGQKIILPHRNKKTWRD